MFNDNRNSWRDDPMRPGVLTRLAMHLERRAEQFILFLGIWVILRMTWECRRFWFCREMLIDVLACIIEAGLLVTLPITVMILGAAALGGVFKAAIFPVLCLDAVAFIAVSLLGIPVRLVRNCVLQYVFGYFSGGYSEIERIADAEKASPDSGTPSVFRSAIRQFTHRFASVSGMFCAVFLTATMILERRNLDCANWWEPACAVTGATLFLNCCAPGQSRLVRFGGGFFLGAVWFALTFHALVWVFAGN